MLLLMTHVFGAVLAAVLYRLCRHHPARWRHASWVAALVVPSIIAIPFLLSTQMTAGVAVAVTLTAMMFWLGLIPLLETGWRMRRPPANEGMHDGA